MTVVSGQWAGQAMMDAQGKDEALAAEAREWLEGVGVTSKFDYQEELLSKN